MQCSLGAICSRWATPSAGLEMGIVLRRQSGSEQKCPQVRLPLSWWLMLLLPTDRLGCQPSLLPDHKSLGSDCSVAEPAQRLAVCLSV